MVGGAVGGHVSELLLIALAFLSTPLVRSRYGARAQAAVEAEPDRQGVRTRSRPRTACASTPAATTWASVVFTGSLAALVLLAAG
ncbi:hypothetical protein AB0O22_10610 [Streptomyces sp. NPDC091204]|uniref:hypothetical protein n=1 Tax=Streptomyces sp. NPDC091204 TaxID=3155299 RepID=UPI003438C7D9